MKIVALSDTHGQHRQISVPSGEILIHCGDFTNLGRAEEVSDFIQWFKQWPHPYKILVAGNHELNWHERNSVSLLANTDIIYLENSGINILGLNIYGSPVTPSFFNWNFMKDRGSEIAEVWSKIPANLDILITHGPPHGILDKDPRGKSVGCEELRKAVEKLAPKVHLFGHLHQNQSEYVLNGPNGQTKCYNVAIVNDRHRVINQPKVIEV